MNEKNQTDLYHLRNDEYSSNKFSSPPNYQYK